jgi:hypothetical protein
MKKIITSHQQMLAVDYGLDGIHATFSNSLSDYLHKNIQYAFEDDQFYLVHCEDPNCGVIHQIRYYFCFDDFANVDISSMEDQLNDLLNKWALTLRPTFY